MEAPSGAHARGTHRRRRTRARPLRRRRLGAPPGFRGRQWSDLRLVRGDRHRPGGTGVPGRRARSGQRGRGRPEGPPLRGGRRLGSGDRARREGPRPDAAIRRCGAHRHPAPPSGVVMSPFTYDPALGRDGHFGDFGGRYVPETLVGPLEELGAAFDDAVSDPAFRAELDPLLRDYVGRETPLALAPRLSEHYGTAPVWFKREDLAHTGAHKINNALGQVLLARRMGKRRIIAETGAGQHGVATATACARLGLECRVYMGAVDMQRQALNVYRMRLMGAEV